MKRLPLFIVIIAVLFALSFCATQPEPEPEPEPTEEPVEEPVEEPEPEPEPELEPVSQDLIRRAEEAIERAREVQAEVYANEPFSEAVDAYDEGMELKESDPDKARQFFEVAIERAEDAYDEALLALRDAYLVRFERYERRLAELEADKFEPEKTEEFYDRVARARRLFQTEQYGDAKELADELLQELEEFTDDLDERIRYVKILKRDTERLLDDADEVAAFIWTPELLEASIINYTTGLEAYRNYRLDSGIDLLSKAKGNAQRAVRLAPEREREYQTEALRQEVEEDIKEASDMTIITDEGEIIGPSEWERNGNEDQEADAGSDETSFLMTDGNVSVLGDVRRQTLLDQAKELYLLGLEEKEKGNLRKANEYFREAGRLTHEYKKMAVGTNKSVDIYETYTLWFITDREWANPFMWPLIWLANRDEIEDPDLIFPGETVLIPNR